MEFLHSKELLGIREDEQHLEDQECLKIFMDNLIYDEHNQNYVVGLPWRPNKHLLPSNLGIAEKRLDQLRRKFMANPEYGIAYNAKIQELHKLQFIEQVKQDTPLGDITHYLSHSGILKTESETTALRVVMDGSCKSYASAILLNDCLFTGPNLLGDMLQCLMSFRQEKFALSADIEKAFLKLQLRIEDRDALRFLFPKDITDPYSEYVVYRYRVVVFGASCSPFLLGAVIKKHIENFVKDEQFKQSL